MRKEKKATISHTKYMAELLVEFPEITDISPTGSSYTCEPPVLDTDIDFVALVPSTANFHSAAAVAGWQRLGSADYGDNGFVSYRKENLNLIVTDDRHFYNRYTTATRLAKQFNLTNKTDRISLFHAVVDAAPRPEIERLRYSLQSLNQAFDDLTNPPQQEESTIRFRSITPLRFAAPETTVTGPAPDGLW